MKAKWYILAVVVLGLVVAPSVGFAAPCPVGSEPCIAATQSTSFQANLATAINGELGLYLIGTWDNRQKGSNDDNASFLNNTQIQLVNPSPKGLWAFVTYWDIGENPLVCVPRFVSSNGFAEDVQVGQISSQDHGAIKVLVTNLIGQPEYGLVGYRQGVHRDSTTGNLLSISEIRLQSVPTKILYADRPVVDAVPDELKKISCFCQPNNSNLSCP